MRGRRALAVDSGSCKPADVKLAISLAAVVLACAAYAPAQAFCSYNGVDNAKTTVAQEFADSTWVVRARVLSGRDHFSDTEESWTTYRIRVERAYKGRPPVKLTFFTFRNSGGFYLDRAWVPLPKGHDVGGEFLLFLNPQHRREGETAAVEGTVFVNYPCGVSRPWPEVSPGERRKLENLARRRDPSSDPLRGPPSPARGEGR